MKYKISIFTILLALVIFKGGYATQSDSTALTFKPLTAKPIHHRVEQVISYLLSHNHYHHKEINDSLSSALFDNFLDILDGNRSYFLKSDIDQFEQYRYQLDDFLKAGNLSVAYEMFNRFGRRFAERQHYISERLKTPFDFTIDEYYRPDRSKEPWADNTVQLDSIWRKRLKNEALNLKLEGKKDDKIYETLQKRYHTIFKRVIQTESEDVFQWYMNAFAEIFDPHTSYMSPKLSDDFKIRMSLSLEGIGASLRTEDDYTKVVDIVPGGPAEKSGLLHPNDRITGVGQGDKGEIVDVIGWRIDDVVQLIRGPKGTKVRLQILRADATADTPPDTIEITRDKVRLKDRAAKSDTLEIKHNGMIYKYGVIDVPDFYLDYDAMRQGDPDYASTSRDVKKLIRQLQGAGVDGIIIDLRNNGGGFLSEAVNLTGLFIDSGPVVQVRNTRGAVSEERDRNQNIYYNGPLAVLVNHLSASASEIFAAAIQDYERGLIIGEQTYGKGTVQNIIRLNRFFPRSTEKLGQIKMTIAKFYRINGGSTQKRGVIPDLEIPSRLDGMKIGERSQKFALSWDEIEPADYHLYSTSLDPLIPRLRSIHQARIHKDPEFKILLEQIAQAKKEREKKLFSLQESKRREIRKKKDKLKDKLKALQKKDDRKKQTDLYLMETAHILSDYLKLVAQR